ncbi:hypothetical protein JOE29_002406 [Pseudomonas sp. PvP009]|nr:hypothetical protein [Pseudomonas sp. PvP009]
MDALSPIFSLAHDEKRYQHSGLKAVWMAHSLGINAL